MLHAGWRMYVSFIREAMKQLHNPMFKDDPTVKDFNKCRYLLFILVRACSEFCIEISHTPLAPDIGDYDAFKAAALRNIDFGWVFFFLSEHGFLVVQFMQSVRSNDGATLDLLWREFYGLAHNGRANKTNYCPMVIMRIYWSLCLVKPLRDLAAAMRTIPAGTVPGTNTGWDMPVERLNGAIRRHMKVFTAQLILTFVLAYSFLEHVTGSFLCATCAGFYRLWVSEPSPRDTDADVALLLDWLRRSVGRDWASVSRVNAGRGSVTSDRSIPPWVVQQDAMQQAAPADAYWHEVEAYVTRLAPWQEWDP